ncbi:MAG: aldehyde dehydrogenase family protein [Acidobacteria bacterium]|nr:aldehyde dehydrogenase family protein [Acidobacteriota bacterium]
MATDVELGARPIRVVNPATGELLREFAGTTPAEVAAAVARARLAESEWRKQPVARRLGIVREFERLLACGKQKIARTITAETGKPYAESLVTEILVTLDAARFLQASGREVLADRPVPHGSLAAKTKRGRLVFEPHGVIGIIAPWNYPFAIPATQTLAALVAGNAVVLKPSELTPLSAFEAAALFSAAGLPKDLFQVVVGDGRAGAALVESGIDKLVFTGSVSTGKKIAQAAASRLVPAVLELGGKDAMIVLADAKVDVASSGAVWGAFVNAGQACLSVERCYVDRKIYEPFIERSREKAARLKVGDPGKVSADMGPLISERQLEIVERQVDDARRKGARVLAGGKRLPALGRNFYAPTVLADVGHDMAVMREETFGAVLPIMAFDTEDEAVELANDSEYGLAASVWTADRRRGERVARRIQAGTVMVNDAVSCYGIREAPHGGIKASGIGRTHGRLGLEEMVRVKYLDVDLMPGTKKPWWYPYGDGMASAAERFLDFQFADSFWRRLAGGAGAVRLIRRPKL